MTTTPFAFTRQFLDGSLDSSCDLLDAYDYDARFFYESLLPLANPMIYSLLGFLATLTSAAHNLVSYYWVLLLFVGVMILRQGLTQKLRLFTRKHGRWRHRKFFPSLFLLLSSVSVNYSQLAHALQLSSGRVLRMVFNRPNYELTNDGSLLPTAEELFPRAVDPVCDPNHFFYPEFFDLLPFDEYADQGELKPSLLHLSGYGRDWMSKMMQQASAAEFLFHDIDTTECLDDVSLGTTLTQDSTSCTSTDAFDLDNILHFHGTNAFSSLDDETASSLSRHLSQVAPMGTIHITPQCHASLTPDFVDTKMLLRSTRLAGLHANPEIEDRIFPVLVDTGCSVSTSGFIEDFDGALVYGDFGAIKTANGMAQIKGFGMLRWQTIDEKGHKTIIRVPGFYAPAIPMRLFSPQDYGRYHSFDMEEPSMTGSHAWFSFTCLVDAEIDKVAADKEETTTVVTHNEPMSRLFFFYCERNGKPSPVLPDPAEAPSSQVPQPQPCPCTHKTAHVSQNVLDPKNANLSVSQKRLLLDHYRFGHVSMKVIQSLYKEPSDANTPFIDSTTTCPPCVQPKVREQLTCSIPKCEICEIARARRRTTGVKKSKPTDSVPVLRVDDLEPGDCFSVDQYESSVRGRLPHTRGREGTSSRYRGGTLCYDHASGKIFARHQVSLGSTETIASKRSIEREALGCGVFVKEYHSDNGIFTSRDFEEALENDEQFIKKSGVGAKHQNAVAERAIGTVQNMARAMLLHVRIHWPDEFDPALWPFALDYAIWIYNHIPHADRANMCPEELFTKTKMGCWALRRARVFGCPAFVLDNRLQDGKKIPKWEPRARTGMFLGFSSEHSTTVGLILNLKTGHISPQFHVVYDELFTTVTTDMTVDLEENWLDLWRNSREFYLEDWDPTVDGELPGLDPDYADESDSDSDDDNEPFDPPDSGTMDQWQLPKPRKRAPRSPTPPPKRTGFFDVEEAEQPSAPSKKVSFLPDEAEKEKDGDKSDAERSDGSASSINRRMDLLELDSDDDDEEPKVADEEPPTPPSPSPRDSDDEEPSSPEPPRPSPTRRTRRGTAYTTSVNPAFRAIKSNLYSHVQRVHDSSNLSYVTLDWESVSETSLYVYFHELFTYYVDPKTKELLDPDAFHPLALASKLESEDYPSFKEILRMDHEEREKWFDSMNEELKVLFESGVMEFVDREEVRAKKQEIVKSTWAFRKKRAPGTGNVTRYKSRLCVRGDLQVDKDTYGPNQTFAPVVDWMTVRLLFTLSIVEKWTTASIDFKSAFTQAQLPTPIYLEPPPGFLKGNPELRDKVIKVKTSLYGDRRAANLWYKKIAATLTSSKLGYRVSEFDPCLFVRKDCIILLYVDDAILMGRDENAITKALSELKDEDYIFSRDGDFKSYLGIHIDHRDDGSIKMSQAHLARSLVDSTGLSDANNARTPSTGPLFRYNDSEPFDRSLFNYRSAIGIAQYLGNNTRPDCAYAINSCARFCVDPREPHGAAVKRLVRYIKGTAEEGLIIKPNLANLAIDCHVDADFAGNWDKSDPEDASCVKSRTGYLITFADVPLVWKSKVQDHIALSTMESEYIALSTAMRTLLFIRALFGELCEHHNLAYGNKISKISTVFEDNRAAKILATTDPPRLTPRSKSLAVRYHWFRSHLGVKKDGSGIIVQDVASALNKADFLTKALNHADFVANRLAVCGW